MTNATDKVRAALERACIWDVEGAEYYREALRELDGMSLIETEKLEGRDGMVRVPVEPSEEQIDCVFPHKGNEEFNNIRYEIRENYRAMIAPYLPKGE